MHEFSGLSLMQIDGAPQRSISSGVPLVSDNSSDMGQSSDAVKEDALKILERDISDSIRSIEGEHLKSSLVIGFSGLVLGVLNAVKGGYSQTTSNIKLALIFLLVSIGVTIWNLSAKPLAIHTDISPIFGSSPVKLWGQYLNAKHTRYQDIYSEAERIRKGKAMLNRTAYLFFFGAMLACSMTYF